MMRLGFLILLVPLLASCGQPESVSDFCQAIADKLGIINADACRQANDPNAQPQAVGSTDAGSAPTITAACISCVQAACVTITQDCIVANCGTTCPPARSP